MVRQSMQTLALVAPVTALYFPAGQWSQSQLGFHTAPENFPPGHKAHAPASGYHILYDPNLHGPLGHIDLKYPLASTRKYLILHL